MKTKTKPHVISRVFSLLLLFVLSVPIASAKDTYQENDANAAHYLSNRRALVGKNCVINRIGGGVTVAGTTLKLGNITNDNLDDYVNVPSVANIDLAAPVPVVGVRDMSRYYAAGTIAGFKIEAASDAQLLSLDVVKVFVLMFYKDGKLVETKASTSSSITGVGLNLITIPGSTDVSMEIQAASSKDFDEVAIGIASGIKVDLISGLRINYAYAGKSHDYTLSAHTPEGIADYSTAVGRSKTLKLTEKHDGITIGTNMIDDDLTNGSLASASLIPVMNTVMASQDAGDTDTSAPFKAGDEVGFVYTSGSLLDLSIAKSIIVALYDKDGKETETFTTSVGVLGLNVINGGKSTVSVQATKDFYGASIFMGGVKVDLGGSVVNYAFIQRKPDITDHHCHINASADVEICSSSYDLKADMDVTWTVESHPQGANPTVTGNQEDGWKAEKLTVDGEYKFKATAADGCYEYTTVTVGVTPYIPTGQNLLVNEGSSAKYSLSDNIHGSSGSLISVSDLKNPQCIMTPSLDDYAYYTGGLNLGDNLMIVGLKSADGSLISDGTKSVRIGFVVNVQSTAINLNLLNFMNIRTYNKGTETCNKVIEGSTVLSASLIGNDNSTRSTKVRFVITVPEGTKFDEIMLWKSGALTANITRLEIYNAFMEDASTSDNYTDPLYKATLVSNETTDATIDGDNTKNITVANIGSQMENLSFIIDNDITTGTTIPQALNASGTVIAVNVGKTVSKQTQLGIVVDNNQYLLGVNLADVLSITTYNSDTKVETTTDWNVLGADVVAFGDKSYYTIRPKADFDQVRITTVGLKVAESMKIYGLYLRSDADGDGIPNVIDTDPCSEDLVFDEDDKEINKTHNYENAKMIFQRTLDKGMLNTFIVPVDMTYSQFTSAFGTDAKLYAMKGLNKNDAYQIDFKLVKPSANPDAEFVQKGIKYLILPTIDPTLGSDQVYHAVFYGETQDVTGPLYIIKGIAYDKNDNTVDNGGDIYEPSQKHNRIKFFGTYVADTKVPAESYVFSKGKMYHTDVEHTVKGFRCWIEDIDPVSAKGYTFTAEDNSATGIRVIEENGSTTNGVYDLSGRKMNGTVSDLPKGIYIINNRKVVK